MRDKKRMRDKKITRNIIFILYKKRYSNDNETKELDILRAYVFLNSCELRCAYNFLIITIQNCKTNEL